MKKYCIIGILIVLTNVCGMNAQVIDDWHIVWHSGKTAPSKLKAVDSLHFGFILNKFAEPLGIILTTDGGKNWKESYITAPLDTHKLKIRDLAYINKKFIYFLADTSIQLGYDGLNPIIDYKAYIFKSTDGGNNWQKIPINDKWRSRRSIFLSMADSLNGIMLQFPSEYDSSETTDQIIFTNDGWKTWEKIKSHPDMKASYNGIYEYPETIVTQTYGYDKIFITHNLGKSWIEKSLPDFLKHLNSRDNFKFFNQDIYFFIVNKLISKDSGSHTNIYKTTDAGDDWKIIYDTKGRDVTDISIINDSTLYTSGLNPLYTSNNGKKWIRASNAYVDNYESYISNIFEFSKDNKICSGAYYIFKYTGGKALQPPRFTAPDSVWFLPLDFQLGWTPIEGANYYDLQVIEQKGYHWNEPEKAPIPNFDSTLFVNDSMLTGVSYKLTGTKYFKTYTCRVRAKNDSLTSPWLSESFVTKEEGTSVSDVPASIYNFNIYPNILELTNNFIIRYELKSNLNIQFSLYNSIGIRVADIFDGYKEAGEHTLQYTPDANLPSGTYWLRMTINNNGAIVKPVVLLR